MAAALPPGTDLNKIPTIPPPPGQTSNFVDPVTLFPATLAVNLILMVWSVVFVGIRLWVRGRGFEFSDFCCVMGLLLSIAYSALVFALSFVVGRHEWDIPLGWIMNTAFQRAALAVGVLSGPPAFFAKLAILLLYLQIFKVSNTMRYGIWFGMAFSVVLYWPFVIVLCWACAPVVGTGAPNNTICADLSPYTITQGVAIVVYDLYIFLLPLPTVIRLRLSPVKKIATLAVFMTASMGIVAGICAMAFRIVDVNAKDTGWVQGQLSMSLSVENYVAVIVSCTPAVSQFTKRYLGPTKFGQKIRARLLMSFGLSPAQKSEGRPTPRLDLEESRAVPSGQKGSSQPARNVPLPSSTIVSEHEEQASSHMSSSEKSGNTSDQNSNEAILVANEKQ